MSLEARATAVGVSGSRDKPGDLSPTCCPYYHEAVELIGRRWTGAIVAVLLDGGPLRFSEISHAVPELSDRRVRDIEPSDIARSEPTETASKVPRAAPEAARRQGRSYPCSRA